MLVRPLLLLLLLLLVLRAVWRRLQYDVSVRK